MSRAQRALACSQGVAITLATLSLNVHHITSTLLVMQSRGFPSFLPWSIRDVLNLYADFGSTVGVRTNAGSSGWRAPGLALVLPAHPFRSRSI